MTQPAPALTEPQEQLTELRLDLKQPTRRGANLLANLEQARALCTTFLSRYPAMLENLTAANMDRLSMQTAGYSELFKIISDRAGETASELLEIGDALGELANRDDDDDE